MLQENDIQNSVLTKIRGGRVSMRSRLYFVLRTILLVLSAALLLAASLFALSFVFFSIRESGIRFLLEFGEHGLAAFTVLFPWAVLLSSLALLVILEILVREFSTVYRFSLLRVFLWILCIGIAGSVLLGLTPLHSSLLSAADTDSLPVLGPLYEQIHDSHEAQGVYRGDVTAVTATNFTISHNDNDRDSDDGTWTVVPPAGFDLGTLSVGERIYVGGQVINDLVYAYGVRPLTGNE